MHTFPSDSRVWIYQSNRVFTPQECTQITKELVDFTRSWESHHQQLYATGEVVHHRFIVLMVDEGQVGAGGCSIDRSVAFLKDLSARYQVDLFNRLLFSYMEQDEVQTVGKEEFEKRYKEGRIQNETLVFDTLVKDKEAYTHSFLKPLASSWHKRMV